MGKVVTSLGSGGVADAGASGGEPCNDQDILPPALSDVNLPIFHKVVSAAAPPAARLVCASSPRATLRRRARHAARHASAPSTTYLSCPPPPCSLNPRRPAIALLAAGPLSAPQGRAAAGGQLRVWAAAVAVALLRRPSALPLESFQPSDSSESFIGPGPRSHVLVLIPVFSPLHPSHSRSSFTGPRPHRPTARRRRPL